MSAGIIFNLSLLITLCVVSGYVSDRFPAGRRLELWRQGFLFGMVAVIGMMLPLKSETGIIFDGRSVILSLASWYFGWRAALVSAFLTGAYRVHLGGGGMPAGVMVILASCGIGLLFRLRIKPLSHRNHPLETLGLGLTVHVVMVLILLQLLPPDTKVLFQQHMVLLILTLYPLATLLAERILADQVSRKEQVRKLVESESRFRTLFENSQLPMLLVEPSSARVLDANPAAVLFYGWSRTELLAKKLDEINVLSMEELRPNLVRAQNLDQNRFQFQHRLASGEIRDVEVYSGPAQLEKRELLYSMIVDVSAIRHSERQLRAALEQRNTILATAMNGFWVTNIEGRILEVNPAYCRMSGYSEAELLQMRVTDLDADELEEDFRETQQRILEGKGSKMERRHRTREGALILVEVSTSILDGSSGIHFFSFFRDITRERARESQMRLHSAMLQAAANTVVITDPAGCIEWANAAFTRTSGFEVAEAAGKTPGELLKSGMHPREFYMQMWETIRKGNIWSGEIINRKKDGTLYEEQMTITPLMEANGVIHHYVAIKQDISEQKNLERMLLRAQRVESMGRLSSGIAHDLNNILSPILMSADLLSTELPAGPQQDMAGMIAECAKRGADVLRQLLAYARGAQGEKQDLVPVPLLREDIKMFKETFPREIHIEEHIRKDLWSIHADPTQLHQLFSNLMLNARDAMPEGGVLLVEAENTILTPEWAANHPPARPGTFVKISVSDNGHGMDSDVMDKMFEPFFTTKSDGKGSGIGLSTVMGILKGHGGFILVDSQPGAGSHFDAYFPSKGDSAPASAGESSPRKTDLKRGNGERVLIVDDETSVGLILQNSLKSLNFETEVLTSGRAALERLGEEPGIDLLLLDYMMPEMNGAAVLKEMDRRGLKIPTMIISGMLPENMMQAGQVMGRPILYKPFSIQELSERVQKVLSP